MEKQTPGATKRLPYTKFHTYSWYSKPPGDGDTECVGPKCSQLPVDDYLGGLGDSLCSLRNGDVLTPGGSGSEAAVPEPTDRGCTTSHQHIRRLKVETYGPLLAAEVADGEMDASEVELWSAEEDNVEDLEGVQDQSSYLKDTLPKSTSCDWSPFQVDEKCYSGNDYSKPDSCSFNCRCETIESQHLYSACSTCSCNLSPHHFHSEDRGDFCADSQLSQEYRGDEEEPQYDGADEVSRMQDGVHCTRKKIGKRQRNRSTTKEQDDGKEEIKREFRAPSIKHKASRKKSHLEGKRPLRLELPKQIEQMAIFCILYFRKFIDIVVAVTHRCGEYVEAAGGILYAFCLLKTHDVDSVKALLKKLAQSLSQQTRSSLVRLNLWVFNWGPVVLRLLKMICALLFLVLMLFVGCLRLCWRHARSIVVTVTEKVRGTTGGVANFTSPHDLPFASRVWKSFGESRTCKYLTELLRKWVWRPWTSKRLRTEASVAPDQMGSPSSAGRSVPNGEVERLLTLAGVPEEDLNPFQVLGVEMTASDIELKKAYRQLAVLVHPDKNTHPRAEEAFKVLRAAWDIVSNPEKRKEYEIKRMSESELAKSMTELLSKLQDDLKEAMNTMMCSKCQGKHKRFEMERDPQSARYCADCSKSHPAEEGDFWAESSMLGLKITYFAMMDGKVYDITEWAGCQRVSITPDTHRVPYHISFGSKNTGTTGRSRAAPESSPATAADLQDLFNRIFQGPPGTVPNGSFFTPPQQTAPPQGSSSPVPPKSDSVSKPETKPKRRKKVRRPFQR